MNSAFGNSRLRNAIERGFANGKIREELQELGELILKSRAEGEDICWGLQQLTSGTKEIGEQTYALACLFQEIEGSDCPAFEVLQEHGIPELLRLFDEISAAPSEDEIDTLLFVLKILGIYGTVDGTLKIVEAAHRPLRPDSFMWSVILRPFTIGHPEKELLFNSLREPLPGSFVALALLNAANTLIIEGDDMSHPFDSAEGRQRLRRWLSSLDSDDFIYAHSATAALPFISTPDRDTLLDLALKHQDSGVQIEAAWASAKIGNDEGLQRLAKLCLDFKTAETAKHYLSGLGREDVIPAEAKEPGFAAMAEFAQWLAHPNELDRVPDELEIVDHRELLWPPDQEKKPFWLIRYTLRDTTGLADDDVQCGLVGSVTFCFFAYELAQRPPEDAYAVHCYWEAEEEGLIEESNVQEETGDYDNLFTQWNGPAIAKPELRYIAEISPDLGHPQRLVGLASGSLNGGHGWLVLDGSRSEWYPQSELPQDNCESVILKIHLGRHLLGFTNKQDRRKFISPSKLPKSPEQIIVAYEKLLAEAMNAEEKERKKAFRCFEPIEGHFDQYVDALFKTGRTLEVRGLVVAMSSHWDYPSGYSKLGNAAYKNDHLDLAEELFLKYRDRCPNYERGEEMGLLAEMWIRQGKEQVARDLMLDCLGRLLLESKTATDSDRSFIRKCFQNQRATFLKLFPTDGQAILHSRSIPASTTHHS